MSAGVRLDSDAVYVLFDNYPASIGPRFISNNAGKDIFIPQGSANEFSAFLTAPRKGVTVGYAVVPQTYATPPVSYAACPSNLWLPNPATVAIPVVKNSHAPVVVNSYTYVLNPASPGSTTTIAGATTQGSTPARFTFTRQDC